LWEGWRQPRLRDMAHLHDYDDEREHGRAASMIGCLSSWSRWIGRPGSARSKRPRGAASSGRCPVRLRPVSRMDNSVRNNGAALLDAVGDPSADPPSDAPAGANPA